MPQYNNSFKQLTGFQPMCILVWINAVEAAPEALSPTLPYSPLERCMWQWKACQACLPAGSRVVVAIDSDTAAETVRLWGLPWTRVGPEVDGRTAAHAYSAQMERCRCIIHVDPHVVIWSARPLEAICAVASGAVEEMVTWGPPTETGHAIELRPPDPAEGMDRPPDGVAALHLEGLDIRKHEPRRVRSWLERPHDNPSCFIIAEAGVNHNGDIGLAKDLIQFAAEAGVDAVKFQTFDPEKLASPDAPMASYQVENLGGRTDQKAMLESLVLPTMAYQVLRDAAADLGLEFLSTPFDIESARFLVGLGVPRLKIPSGEVTNWPFLDSVASLGLPVILSTGMSTLTEVAGAVGRLRGAGVHDLTILHCVSNYPAAPASTNLRAMATLAHLFELPVGLSDHTEGTHVSVAAAANGATVIEKHFTLDRNLPGPDHKASLEPGELALMVRQIREVHSSLGTGVKRPTPEELDTAKVVRRSLYVARDVAEGQRLQEDDVIALRPATGLSPTRIDSVLGRSARRALVAGERLTEEDFA